MNIAFTTIVLFLFIAPGLISRIAYRSSRLSARQKGLNLFNELANAIIPALLIQTAFIFVVELITSYRIDFEILGSLMLGVSDKAEVKVNFDNIRSSLYPIFWYNFSVLAFSYGSGHLLREVIRYLKLDRKYPYLRFSNKWHYLLSGECLDFPDVPDKYEDISFTLIDVLVEIGGEGVIYMGELFDYNIDEKGELEEIQLRYPVRRKLSADHSHSQESELNQTWDSIDEGTTPHPGSNEVYYVIPSRFILIPFSQIKNLNVDFYSLEAVDEADIPKDEKEYVLELEDDDEIESFGTQG